MMARVFVPQVPSRFDRGANIWVPNVDIASAGKFGDIVIMLPPEANRLNTAPLLSTLRKRMKNFDADDYIVALGDPTIIGIVAAMAAKRCNGRLRMLKWDRQSADYLPLEVMI